MNKSIEKIDIESAEYPAKLREIANPPKQLYCMGNTELLGMKSVAVVGSRKFTIYGKGVARLIGKKIGDSGLIVVSGLAYGIDSFAHQGMLEGKGKGIAVLGSGIRKMGPKRNRELMMNLVDAEGLVVSEYEPEEQGNVWTFPARNRIISGLSEAVVVVEANYNSGALITAQHANEQGRAIYSVPGNINSQFSLGSNLLIRDGAIPLIVIDDVVRDMGYEVYIDDKTETELGEDEKRIVGIVKKYNGITADRLATLLNTNVSRINAQVTILEIKGVVEIYSGKIHLVK